MLEPFILAVCEGHPSRFDSDSRSSSSSDSTNARAIEILAQTCFDRICESASTAPPCVPRYTQDASLTFSADGPTALFPSSKVC